MFHVVAHLDPYLVHTVLLHPFPYCPPPQQYMTRPHEIAQSLGHVMQFSEPWQVPSPQRAGPAVTAEAQSRGHELSVSIGAEHTPSPQ